MRTQLIALCLFGVVAGPVCASQPAPAEIAAPLPKQVVEQPRPQGGPDVIYEIPRQGCQEAR